MRLRFIGAALLFLAAGIAAAQTGVVVPSAAERCLTRTAGAPAMPTYPEREFEARAGGAVRVVLRFDRADAPPKVTVVDTAGGHTLAEAVLDFAKGYRVPCLESGQTALLRQEFAFRPTDGRRVVASGPQDADAQRQSRLLACIKHADGLRRPIFPIDKVYARTQTVVLLKLKYANATDAPQVTSLDNAADRHLVHATRLFAEGLRMPCHEGDPVEQMVSFRYGIEGEPRSVLADPSFVAFLRGVKGIREANVYFDFNTMGCPFDVRLWLFQPHAPNIVGEIGSTNPERRFFVDWLRRQQLELDARRLNAVIGQHMDLRVPCAIVSLGNEPGGGAGK
jgi:hypothetical protein